MITVLGGTGFVGRHIVKALSDSGVNYFVPQRNEDLTGKDLGEVIYCIGLTSDFRKRPFDTVEAHVSKLSYILQNTNYHSFTYFSSTRVYVHNTGKVNEDMPISIDINNPNDLFNVTKLAGELLLLNSGKLNVKMIRLSNVYGDDFESDNFLSSIIKDAVTKNSITLRTTPGSAKDYISIEDVVDMTLKISAYGKQKIYNLASGIKTENNAILAKIQELLGCEVIYDRQAEDIVFPDIDVTKIVTEFGYVPKASLLNDMERLIKYYKSSLT